ncbi:IMPACT family protein [Bordetella bronchialis]|uniref:Thymidylate synthase n=1 Tax=Bordetella bronchialis TaxID=463025 RepID=A0A193FHE9_9BORD|nr:YigZ family protein [Bordetella bronchialis]ANN66668.1 thymidylate synthase [Bordetella bronchialis]ANN71747.1 thymidylate synthase [Bordetella bronchialis]
MPSTLAAIHAYRETIKKSVFLAHAGPAGDVDAAMAFIAAHSDPGATHNCWAYRIGAAYRFSDDGEPGGTAGRPMLQAIEGQDCDRVAVVVTRWYGGINLGTGGLARAYGGAAANCLRLAPRVEIVDTVDATCACAYTDLQQLKAHLAQAGASIAREDFQADGVVLALTVPRQAFEALNAWFVNLTRGKSSLRMRE